MAIAVFAIAGLGLMAALTKALSAQNYSSHQTTASLIAESVAREASLAGPPNWGVSNPPQPQSRQAVVGQEPTPVTFFYEVSAVSILRDGNPVMGELWEVTVRVWWAADGPERGRSSLEATRMVYVET